MSVDILKCAKEIGDVLGDRGEDTSYFSSGKVS